MNNRIEIPISKKKSSLLLVGSVLFVIGATLMLIEPKEMTMLYRWFGTISAETVRIIGIVGIVFFGITGIYSINKFFDKKAGLIIDQNGITDNSNALSIGLIEWKDITKIELIRVASVKFLMIHVFDSEKYIDKAKNRIKAKLMRINLNTYDSPISITSNTLKYDFEKLEKLILSEFENNKKH